MSRPSTKKRGKEDWAAKLTRWYSQHKRAMPWRSRPTPYRIWVSEVMLQQTQVQTVIPYFNRFMTRFPTVKRLSEAPLQQILKTWEGLGYYARARNLHRAARWLVDEKNGRLPQTYSALMEVPGLGFYTAAAVASIAFEEAVPVVDGNVLRLTSRLWGLTHDISKPAARETVFKRLIKTIPSYRPSEFNQALMECGALICRPTRPRCSECPISTDCVALKENRISELPVKSRRSAVPHFEIAVGVIWRRGKILIAQRRESQMLGGLWEFPGGKRQAGEPLLETARREILEETGLHVRVVEPIRTVRHRYTHFSISLTAFHCEVLRGKAIPKESAALQWILPSSLDQFPFPRANLRIIESLKDAVKTPPRRQSFR